MYSFEENLIALVRDNDFLFNTKSRKYKNVVNRDSAWVKIAKELHRPVDDCRQRWKSLRDRYVREKKKSEQPSGSGATDVPTWDLYTHLEFLNEVVKPRNQFENHDPLSVPIKLDENSGTPDVPSPTQDSSFSFNFTSDPVTPTVPPKSTKRSRKTAFEFAINEFLGNVSQTLSQRFNTPDPEEDENDMFMKMISKKMKVLPEESKIRLQATILKEVNNEILIHIRKKVKT